MQYTGKQRKQPSTARCSDSRKSPRVASVHCHGERLLHPARRQGAFTHVVPRRVEKRNLDGLAAHSGKAARSVKQHGLRLVEEVAGVPVGRAQPAGTVRARRPAVENRGGRRRRPGHAADLTTGGTVRSRLTLGWFSARAIEHAELESGDAPVAQDQENEQEWQRQRAVANRTMPDFECGLITPPLR